MRRQTVSRHEGLMSLLIFIFLVCCGVPVAVAAFGSEAVATFKQPLLKVSIVVIIGVALGVLLFLTGREKKTAKSGGKHSRGNRGCKTMFTRRVIRWAAIIVWLGEKLRCSR